MTDHDFLFLIKGSKSTWSFQVEQASLSLLFSRSIDTIPSLLHLETFLDFVSYFGR